MKSLAAQFALLPPPTDRQKQIMATTLRVLKIFGGIVCHIEIPRRKKKGNRTHE